VIRASVIPYGRTGLVVADDRTEIDAQVFAVGYLADRPEGEDGPKKIRVVPTASGVVPQREPKEGESLPPPEKYLGTTELAERIVAVLRAHHVKRLFVEQRDVGGRAAELAKAIGEPIEAAAAAAGIAVESRNAKAWREIAVAADPTWNASTPDVIDQARRMLAIELDTAKLKPAERAALKKIATEAPIVATLTEQLEASVEQAAEREAEQTEASAAAGPCVLAIDPGSHWTAVVLTAKGPGDLLRLVHRQTFVLGKLAKGKAGKKGKRTITDDDRRKLRDDLWLLFANHDIRRTVVELVAPVYGPGGRVPMSKATELAATKGLAFYICGICDALDHKVETVSEARWHAAVLPGVRTKQGRTGALLGRLEKAFTPGAWDKSNEHERDAGGVALYAAMPPKKPKRVSRAAAPVEGSRFVAKRAAARQRKREAIGCICKGRRRHTVECEEHRKAKAAT
jgi:hypothetical protein